MFLFLGQDPNNPAYQQMDISTFGWFKKINSSREQMGNEIQIHHH